MQLDSSMTLIADDDLAVRDGLASLLRHSGYGSITCPDAEAAVEAYDHYRPGVALVDICFSGPFDFEGLSLIERMRAMEPAATIIAMSGRGAEGLAEQAVQHGASAFLAKPFAYDDLLGQMPACDAAEASVGSIRIPSIDEILTGGLLTMHFQPIIDLRDDRTIGYEALARVAAAPPFRSPAGLLRYARRIGRIADVNRACVAEALRTGGCLTESGLLFINVDPEVLEIGGAFADAVEADVRREGIDPRMLVFEVTERSELSSADLDTLRALRQLGASIALDDVGGGFTHFAQLESILPSFMKIPAELGACIATNRTNRLIVSHLAEVAHGVGCRVVIEGMETEAALRAARELAVDYAQGFHVGKPAPLHEVKT